MVSNVVICDLKEYEIVYRCEYRPGISFLRPGVLYASTCTSVYGPNRQDTSDSGRSGSLLYKIMMMFCIHCLVKNPLQRKDNPTGNHYASHF